MKICSVENCNNGVFGKGFCKYHYPAKVIKKSPLSKSKGFAFTDSGDVRFRDKFFMMIWTKRRHKSEVSGALLGSTPNSMFFHHILAKRNYPEAEFDEENIILLTPEEHASVELDIYKYEEINKRRELLKVKYNIL